MRNGAIASLLVVAILAGAGVGYLVGNVNERTTTLYSSIPFTTTLYSNAFSAQTITVYPDTFTSTSCTYTGLAVIGCPHYWNQTYTILVNYTGAWIASYQGYLGTENESNLAEAGTFYGHAIGNQSFTIAGWTQGQEITACAEAQKLDSSNSTLVLSFPPVGGAKNATSSAFGTAKFCIIDVIV